MTYRIEWGIGTASILGFLAEHAIRLPVYIATGAVAYRILRGRW